jgi:hypothetical protein
MRHFVRFGSKKVNLFPSLLKVSFMIFLCDGAPSVEASAAA